MKTFVLHDTFNVYHFTTSTWEHPVHNHTYYEIIFILNGSGIHTLNGRGVRYRRGDVFFLGPSDYHAFDISRTTEFCYIRFAHSVISKAFGAGQQNADLALLQSRAGGFRITRSNESKKLHSLLYILKEEYDNRIPGFEEVCNALIKTILLVINRNVRRTTMPEVGRTSPVIDELFQFIRNHIHNPASLSIEMLAEKFNYSAAYLGTFFRNQTGKALKPFIIQYRLKLVEARLLYTTSTLGEIADEFGFTDESHLCRQFRKYIGVSPMQFRKRA